MDSNLIAEKDYVQVEDKATGQVLPDPIPKHWVGTDLAPGVKAVSRSRTGRGKGEPDADGESEKPEGEGTKPEGES